MPRRGRKARGGGATERRGSRSRNGLRRAIGLLGSSQRGGHTMLTSVLPLQSSSLLKRADTVDPNLTLLICPSLLISFASNEDSVVAEVKDS